MPLPPEPGNYAAEFIPAMRTDLKPVAITQPEGPSFAVDGHAVTWQKWHFRIGFTPREGLVLHTVGYEDGGRIRPVLYRAALSEMVVPYGDPHPSHNRKNAFDVGEYGIGMLANALELGCDCLGEIRYFDAFLTDSRGEVVRYQNAVCMHEEDAASSGSTSTGARTRPRCAARAAWSSRSSPRSATTSTASTGTSTRTARSSTR